MVLNKQTRTLLKSRRTKLSAQQLDTAAQGLSQQFNKLRRQLKTSKIASYLASNGEISPSEILKSLPHSRIFIPRISSMRHARMAFHSIDSPLRYNRFNILEPTPLSTPENLHSFDIILVPLIAFDRKGNRIGMGGGFYDRALAFKKRNRHLSRPLLIGLAHDFQELENINAQAWDVPLDVILTDRELIKVTV